MSDIARLVADNLDISTDAIERKNGAGRGGSGKQIRLYGIDRLRAMILDLAVRGKLVPQDSTDEPASTLMARISAERKALQEAGKISKPKRLPSLDLRGLTIPPNWAAARFGSVFSLEYGDNLPKPKRSGTGEYDVYGSNGVVGTHNSFSVDQPCLVIGRKGSAGAINKSNQPCWVTDVAYYCIPPAGIDLEFQHILFRTLRLEELGKGIKPGLNRNEVNVLAVLVPPLAEQRRIVAKVHELMALCDCLERESADALATHQTLVETLLATLVNGADAADLSANWARLESHFDTLFTTESSIDALKQTILDLAVRGKLVKQDARDEPASTLIAASRAACASRVRRGEFRQPAHLGKDRTACNLPKGWAATRLGDVVRVINGRAYSKPELLGEGTPVLRVGNLFTSNDWYFSNLELEPDKYIDSGDLIYAWSASFGPFIWQGGRVIYHYHIWKLEPFDELSVSREFLCLYLQNKTAGIRASGHGIAMLHMTKERMEKLVLDLPPLAEQHRIVAKVHELMALCDTLRARITDAAETRRHLADAFTERAAA